MCVVSVSISVMVEVLGVVSGNLVCVVMLFYRVWVCGV